MKKGILGVLVAIAICLSLTSHQSHAAVSGWQKGISVQSRSREDFGSATFRQSIDTAINNGVNYVTLVIPVHQETIHSSYVYTGDDTPSDAALRSGLGYLKSKGIGSALAIHNNPYDNQWRAFIKASNNDTWFNSYGSLVNRYAEIGQQVGMTQMIIGTELSSMTVPENTSRWNALIGSVRDRFSGSLTYSAQRTGYMSDAQSLGFWSQLDKIGLSAYYGLGNDGDVQSLKNAWTQWDQAEVSVLAAKYGKQVVFTEVGYVSRDGATSDPGTGYNLNTPINTGLQANAYQALLEYWQNSPLLAGVFFWDWSSDPNAGGQNDGGYTPQNKPAEAVIKKWFTTGSNTTLPPAVQADEFTVTSVMPKDNSQNSKVTVPVSIASKRAISDALVDIEIYNEQNEKVAQTYVENQSLGEAPKTYSLSWTPSKTGTYTVKAGVFTANWSSNLYWSNNIGSVIVKASVDPPPAPIPTPPPVTPEITPMPTPVIPSPTNTPTPAEQLPTALSIWWPGDNSQVSGVQPYKAIIDGRDVGTYDIYWQVDNGVLNKLGENSDPIAHKESAVDMTNWKWNASGVYRINFVSKDKTGAILSQKQITLRL